MSKDYTVMKAKELHAEMKERGIWPKNGQFLLNEQKIVILEEGSLKNEKVLAFLMSFEKKMVKMRKKQSKNISKALLELYDTHEETVVGEEEVVKVKDEADTEEDDGGDDLDFDDIDFDEDDDFIDVD